MYHFFTTITRLFLEALDEESYKDFSTEEAWRSVDLTIVVGATHHGDWSKDALGMVVGEGYLFTTIHGVEIVNHKKENTMLDPIKEYFKANHDQRDMIDWDNIEIEVLSSGGGYYIGALDPEDGAPLVRLSTEYWKNLDDAEEALKTGNFTAKLWL